MASKEATRFIGNLLNWIVKIRPKIVAAMSAKAQWEIWLQVEMALFLNKNMEKKLFEKWGTIIAENH